LPYTKIRYNECAKFYGPKEKQKRQSELFEKAKSKSQNKTARLEPSKLGPPILYKVRGTQKREISKIAFVLFKRRFALKNFTC